MKRIALIAALAALPALAAAHDRDPSSTWQPGVPRAQAGAQPTGYEVRGCTHYDLDGARVIEICNERSVADVFRWHDKVSPDGGSDSN